MQDFKKFRVWHLANDVAIRVVEAFPADAARTVPGLRSQVIRAATSVAANIAEGCGRATRTEFLHFIEIAIASRNELEGDLRLARATGVLPEGVYALLQRDVDLLHRMLISLMRTLQRRIAEEENAKLHASS